MFLGQVLLKEGGVVSGNAKKKKQLLIRTHTNTHTYIYIYTCSKVWI